MTVFWGLLIALGVVWVAVAPREELWTGLLLFGLIGVILLGVRWIGADHEES